MPARRPVQKKHRLFASRLEPGPWSRAGQMFSGEAAADVLR